MDITFAHGNNFWKNHDTMTETVKNVWQTYRTTDWTIHRAAWSQLKKSWLQKMQFHLVVQNNHLQKGTRLECLRSEIHLMITDPDYWFTSDLESKPHKSKLQIEKKMPKLHTLEFCNKPEKQHTFWSCLIRCVNIKWIRLVLWKLQSGHDSVNRRTDGQTDDVKPVYPPSILLSGGIISSKFLNIEMYCFTQGVMCISSNNKVKMLWA